MGHPLARAAHFPPGYGQTAETLAELQVWTDVARRIAAASNYLLATVDDEGRPHQRPVDGVLVGTTLAFGGSPEARWVRHLHARPSASMSLPDDDDAVVLEGTVELVTDPEHDLTLLVREANLRKYPQYYDTAESPPSTPFWALHLHRVYAWSLAEFPRRATRFDFLP